MTIATFTGAIFMEPINKHYMKCISINYLVAAGPAVGVVVVAVRTKRLGRFTSGVLHCILSGCYSL